MRVELICNTKRDRWSYAYKLEDKEKEFPEDEILELIKEGSGVSIEVLWHLSVKLCYTYFFRLSKSATNDSEFEDIIQESYIAFVENIEKLRLAENIYNYKSRFVNYTKFRISKNNIHSRDICDKNRAKRYKNYLRDYMVKEINHKEGLTLEEKMSFKDDIKKVKKKLTKEEYDDIFNHFHLGKAYSLQHRNIKANITYKRRIKKLLEKVCEILCKN